MAGFAVRKDFASRRTTIVATVTRGPELYHRMGSFEVRKTTLVVYFPAKDKMALQLHVVGFAARKATIVATVNKVTGLATEKICMWLLATLSCFLL